MKLEVLMSCMHQIDDTLVQNAGLTGDVLVINQCDCTGYAEYKTTSGTARMFSTQERGLTKSRNQAIRNAKADVCLICDDDETFIPDYEHRILNAYEELPEADLIIFKIANRPSSFKDKVMRLRFPMTMKVSSWQISFRRERLLQSGVFFDELLGAGSGNGAEEELKFLLDCERAGLKIFYVPELIASVAQEKSTWFDGFNETFFENRGATTKYILGSGLAFVYALYYIIRKRPLYQSNITPMRAFRAIMKGIREDRITKQAMEKRKTEMKE